MKSEPKITSTFRWDDLETYSTDYLSKPVLAVCRKLQPQSILDIGCGNGSFTKELCTLDAEIIGVDYSAEGIEMARRRAPAARFEVFDVNDDPSQLSVLPTNSKGFDLVISTEVIEHLYYPCNLVRLAKSKLHPSGRLILSTPYHGFLKNMLLSLTNTWDHHLQPHFDGGHIKFWSKKTITAFLASEGFTVEQFYGAGRCYGVWKSMIVVCRIS